MEESNKTTEKKKEKTNESTLISYETTLKVLNDKINGLENNITKLLQETRTLKTEKDKLKELLRNTANGVHVLQRNEMTRQAAEKAKKNTAGKAIVQR
jgi:regulator of replication initiation timing